MISSSTSLILFSSSLIFLVTQSFFSSILCLLSLIDISCYYRYFLFLIFPEAETLDIVQDLDSLPPWLAVEYFYVFKSKPLQSKKWISKDTIATFIVILMESALSIP